LSFNAYPYDIDSYFDGLDAIMQSPSGSSLVKECDDIEKNKILKMLGESYKDIELDGTDVINVFKGDFSNEGNIEYAVIIMAGFLRWQQYYFYKLDNNKLINLDFDKVVATNFYHGDLAMMQDYSKMEFNHHIASPFAITLNGKTYIRFMSYPAGRTEYDKFQLQLCTYLWEGNKFTLSGPNLDFSRSTGKLENTEDCPGPS